MLLTKMFSRFCSVCSFSYRHVEDSLVCSSIFRSNYIVGVRGGDLLAEHGTDPRGSHGPDISKKNDLDLCHQQYHDVVIRYGQQLPVNTSFNLAYMLKGTDDIY